MDSNETMSIYQPFDQVVSESEIEALRALYHSHGRVHPLVSVAMHPGAGQNSDQIAVNTCRALQYALQAFPDWVRNLKRRLLDQKDWTNSESALAEIRACGMLAGSRLSGPARWKKCRYRSKARIPRNNGGS